MYNDDNMNRYLQPPPRQLDPFSHLVILLGGLYSTAGWLLLAAISMMFWGVRLGSLDSHLFLKLLAPFVIFLSVGAIYRSIRSGGLAVRLLKEGIVAEGTLVGVEYEDKVEKSRLVRGAAKLSGKGNTEEEIEAQLKKMRQDDINNTPQNVLVNYYVKFQAQNGKEYTTKTTTNYRDGAKMEDEETEMVLYLKRNPDKALIFDGIFHVPEVSGNGHFVPLPPQKVGYLVLPFGVMIGNAICCFLYFGML